MIRRKPMKIIIKQDRGDRMALNHGAIKRTLKRKQKYRNKNINDGFEEKKKYVYEKHGKNVHVSHSLQMSSMRACASSAIKCQYVRWDVYELN